MPARKKPIIRNRDLERFGGAALWLVGSLLLWDAYSNRGEDRPIVLRALGIIF
jgi:hypothetical protein